MDNLSNTTLMLIKLRKYSESVIDWLPFTFGGAILLLSSVLATWFFGVQRTDLVLIILGVVGVSVSLLGCVLTIFTALLVQSKSTDYGPFSSTFQVHNHHRIEHPIRLPWWIPLVQASWEWRESKCTVEIDGEFEITTPFRRGHISEIRRKISICDAFGICEIRIWSVQSAQIRILPRNLAPLVPNILHGLQSGSDLANPFGRASGDRMDIRNYAYGDPVRFILWKVYARTGQLVVRTPEKALDPVQRLVSYLVVGPTDSVAAGVASEVLNSKTLGDNWVFGVDGHTGDCTDSASALEAIVQSGDSRIENGDGLQDFILRHQDASSLLLFAPASSGSWISIVQQISSYMPVQVVLAGVLPTRTNTVQKILFEPDRNVDLATFEPSEVEHICGVLESSGVLVRIVCPEWGSVLSPKDFQHRLTRAA